MSIFISTSAYAVELANDTFDNSSLDGWSGTGVASSNGSLVIDRDRTASQTYNFGTSYANQTLTIEFYAEVPSGWEDDTENNTDYFNVLINGSVVETYYSSGGIITETFTAVANSSGSITLGFNPDTTADSEDADIDWITIDGTPIGATVPISEYRMDECIWDGTSNEVIDSVSLIHGTSFNGSDTNTEHRVCRSGHFDGTDDYVSMGNSFNNIFGSTNDEFTITAWIKPEALSSSVSNHGTANTFIAKASDPSNDNLEIGITPGGQLHLYLDTSGNDTQANFGSGITVGSWYFIAVTYDGSDVSVTINNSTTTDGRWSGNMDQANGSPFTIGTTLHIDTSFNGLIDEVKIYDTALSTTEINNIYTNENTGNDYTGTSRTCQTCIDLTMEAIDDSFTTLANTSLTANVFDNDTGTGFNIIAADASSLQGIITTYAPDTGAFTFQPNTDFVGTTSFTYTISDDGGITTSTATVQINVTGIAILANDDSYDTNPGVSLRNNLLLNDVGIGIEYTSMTNAPTLGTVTVQTTGDFTYTPNSGVSGTDTFTYLITDDFGSTDEATVTIVISTDFTSGSDRDFELINPDFSRNVIGDYKIAGNTVLCLTSGAVNGYGGTCTNDEDVTSNIRVSKYLDIDNNSGTWNSTSSYINFDAPYEPARGIIWAGLFWGGRISTDDNNPIRYAVENGPDAFSRIEVGENSNINSIDIETTGATNIKLKIDNGNYADVLASTFHISPSSGGETYAAFADVSSIVQSADLTLGKHVFTVANLTTMEGRENSPGAFGGWSLVVIYGEGYEFGKPRNISIYNGFIDIGTNNDPIEISGFKLPETGDVSAQLSVFSGEGEYLYGRNDGSTNEDWMKISRQESTGYDYMPGKTLGTHLGNRDNMFDATLDGILRDSITGEFNDLSNNNVGVDIDNYDVSDLLTGYRTADPTLDSVFIQMYSNQDYITPSMMAFSAELYVPELCYDYTLDIDGYVLPSLSNEIQTHFGGFGKPLTTVLYLKSLEGDIDLSNVNINYSILDVSQLTYNDCTTEISETGEYDYSDACIYTHDATTAGFGMYVGAGKTTASGGIISAFEDRYIKFDSDFHASTIDTSFEFSVDYTVDYGSGAVPLHKIFTPADLCEPTSGGFLPEMGYFNVTDITNDIDEWNLYSQVSRRPFDLRLYAYQFDAGEYLTAIGHDLNLSLEVEVIRADNFNRDANTACNDEHSALTDVPPKFLHFNESRSIDFGYDSDDINFAYRSAAMRVWYLTDVSGNGTLLDDHNCTRESQSQCVDLYTAQYTGDASCTNECRTIASSGNCYDCLRSNYGRKVCSRDNFAIRPESFITQIYDSNQSNDTNDPSNHIANSIVTASEFALVSGYNYRFDINATNHVNDTATPRYIQHFEPGGPTHYVRMNWYPDAHDSIPAHVVTGCNDVEDKNITLNIFGGSNVNPVTDLTYTDEVDQIGKYRFVVYDENWTSADWNPSEMLHHQTGSPYANYYKSGADCIQNSDYVSSSGANDQQGCAISSVHTNPSTGTEYKYLYAQYYPYAFDETGLTFGARPSNDGSSNTFVYINTPDLTLYPNGIDEDMSYNVQGTFTAVGRMGDPVSNFVENCYADSVNMSLYQNYNHAVPATEPFLSYDLIDFNTTDNTNIIRPRENGIFNQTNIATSFPVVPLIIPQAAQYFKKDMNGSLTMDLGYNYVRAMNVTLNPRDVTMQDFNLTYTTPPPGIFVDLKTDHQIFGNRDLNQSVSFIYGRSKPGKFFYEDIITTSVNTPVSIVAYCDLGFTECQNRGIMAAFAKTNEDDWWLSIDHRSTNNDGNIVLQVGSITEGGGSPTVAPGTPNALSIIANATDSTVNVAQGATPTLPMTVEIDFETDTTVANFTNRWLIHNEYDDSVPSPFYKVRFIGDSNWTGIGDEGMVVGTEASKRKTKRLDW